MDPLESTIPMQTTRKLELPSVKTPEELYTWMEKNLTYDGANKRYLRQPTDVINDRKAHCWEAVEFQRTVLKELKIKTVAFYLETVNCTTTHTALVYIENNAVYWMEWAWGQHCGIHKYATFLDAIDAIRNAFLAQYRTLAVFTRSEDVVIRYGHAESTAVDRMRGWTRADSTRTLSGFQILPTSKANIEFFKSIYPNLRHVRTGFEYFGDLVVDLTVPAVVAVLQCSTSKYITALEVNPIYRRKGLATHLLKTAVTRYANTKLTVNKNNGAAIGLYLAHGWVVEYEKGAMYYMQHASKQAPPKPVYANW